MDFDIQIDELIKNGGVLYDVEGSTPAEVYKNVCTQCAFPENLTSQSVYAELMQREELMSTAVGHGIAIPHPRHPLLKEARNQQIIVAYLKNPIVMNAPDAKPVYVLFLILTCSAKVHLQALSRLAFLFQRDEFRRILESKPNRQQFLQAITATLRTRP
ncbi:MAG: PTS sugar transporter subunit IIA [Treponemataceae bacterium]|nr:PTS sugar transporter subunit IIA [Treponemataceae bacterium]